MLVNNVQKHVELVNLQEEQRPHGISRKRSANVIRYHHPQRTLAEANFVRSGPSTKAFSYS